MFNMHEVYWNIDFFLSFSFNFVLLPKCKQITPVVDTKIADKNKPISGSWCLDGHLTDLSIIIPLPIVLWYDSHTRDIHADNEQEDEALEEQICKQTS